MDWLSTPLSALVTSGGTVFIAILTMRNNAKIKRIDANSAATAEQTVNNHHDAEFPNLREEQTAMREKVNSVSDDMTQLKEQVRALRGANLGVAESIKRVEKWLEDLAKGNKYLDDTISRKEIAAEQALKAAVEERNLQFQQRDTELDSLRRELPGLITGAVDTALSQRERATP